nr:defensin-like protein 1 [Ipomoea batatas]
MKPSMNVPLVVVFMIMMLLSTNDVGPIKVEARLCNYRSQKFTGVCVVGNKCHSSCLSQGFAGGHCHGLRHLCYCYKNC